MAANCALAAGQPQAAMDRAGAAYRHFRAQQSAWWQAQAGLVLARARYRIGPSSVQALRAADRAAGRLEQLGAAEATLAHLLAGRIALDLGRSDDADRHLRAAAREPAARPGDVPGQRLARRSAPGRGRGRSAPDVRRLPSRA